MAGANGILQNRASRDGLIAPQAAGVFAAFLAWTGQQARDSALDHILFLLPSCAALASSAGGDFNLPAHSFLPGSPQSFLVAGTDHRSFDEHLPLLIHDFEGRSLAEGLRRIGAAVPADHVLADLGFGLDLILTQQDHAKLRSFLLAYRREILRATQRVRGEIFRSLIQSGVRPGMNIAVVDLGWDGATIEAFARVMPNFLEAEVSGYSFALVDTTEVRQRQSRLFLRGWLTKDRDPDLLSAAVAARDLLDRAFANSGGGESAPDPGASGRLEALTDLVAQLTGAKTPARSEPAA